MKNLMTTAALSLTLIGASTVAFADAHEADDIMTLTCGDFTGMELADQEQLIVDLKTIVDRADMNDGVTVGTVVLLCNGFEDETVFSVVDNEDA